MRVSLSKTSKVPLHQQLAEQIVFLITTGALSPAAEVPSVRSLARRLKIHHNTVSKAYRDLVRRGWLKGQPGSRLHVKGPGLLNPSVTEADLDELINESIQRARGMGYSLQELRERVLERLAAQSPDYVLVVEQEPELRQILQEEIRAVVSRQVEGCTPDELINSPYPGLGAQVVAPDYAFEIVRPLVPKTRPCIPLRFSPADEQVILVHDLGESSVIAVVSVSRTLLKTARSLLASVLGRRHEYKEVLLPARGRADLRGPDLVFCDSVVFPRVRSDHKVRYELIAPGCLADIRSAVEFNDSKRESKKSEGMRASGIAPQPRKSSL